MIKSIYSIDYLTKILSDETKTSKELMDILEISSSTISRWRKKLGIIVPRGCKKGKSKIERIKKDFRMCLKCSNSFVTIPSSKQKYCGRSCAAKAINKVYMKTEKYSLSKQKPNTLEYKRYRNKVTKLTYEQYKIHHEKINPFGYIIARAGIKDAYHIDHIISVRFGFDNSLAPEKISDISNLQLLPWKENISKGSKC